MKACTRGDGRVPATAPAAPLLGDRRLWLLLLALVTASRLLLLPATPLDLTETGAACRALDPRHHTAHSPAQHLWAAIAGAGLLLTGDPILLLQLVIAATSVLSVHLLAWLWRHALAVCHLDPDLGPWAALLYAFVPGVWVHAWRASSATVTVCLSAAALCCWLRSGRERSGRERSGRVLLLLGALLLAAAALLCPAGPLPVLLLLAVPQVRSGSWTETVAAAALCLAVIAGVAVCFGPPEPVCTDPGTSLGQWRDLGPVRLAGHPLLAAATLVLAATGAWRMARGSGRTALLCSAGLLLASLLCLLPAGQCGSTGAALPLAALLTGPVVVGIASLPKLRRMPLPVPVPLLVSALCCASAVWTVPLCFEVARQGSQPLAALVTARGEHRDRRIIVGADVQPFADLLAASGRPVAYLVRTTDLQRQAARIAGKPWALVTLGEPASWLRPPATSPHHLLVQHYQQLARLDPLGRYSALVVASGGLLLEDGKSAGEPLEPARAATFLLQPQCAGCWLGIVAEVWDQQVQLELRGWSPAPRRTNLEPGRHRVYLPANRSRSSRRGPVQVRRLDQGGGRVLLQHLWIDRPGQTSLSGAITPDQQASGLGGLMDGDGFYDIEQLGDPPRPGRWTGAEAWLTLPVGPGRLQLDLTAPRPHPARVTVRCRQTGWQHRVVVSRGWQQVEIPIDKHLARVHLHFTVDNPFVPADLSPESGAGAAADQRRLGVVLGELRLAVR